MASPNRFEISEQTHSANFAMYNFHSHSWYEIFYLQSGLLYTGQDISDERRRYCSYLS